MRLGTLPAVLLVVSGCGGSGVADEGSDEPRAGVFRGARDGRVSAFLGIRFAEAPLGELRWRPPVPAPYPAEPTVATAFAPPPPQLPDVEEGASAVPQSEDCLFLNVWTPSPRGQRPVLVFVHGGGWVNGGTVDPWYGGARLAERADAVVVTITYRLGPLGFLDLSEVGGEEYASSGNLGILDQQLALAWVHEHIADFGGDPGSVTLVGQSAGGQSAALHMALPESRSHFQRVIAQSGALALLHTQATARATAQRFMQHAGVGDLAGLRALDQAAIMEAEQWLEDENMFSDLLFGPVLDGALFPEPPMEAIVRGDAASIPLLSGTTRDETKYWYFYLPELVDLAPRAAASLLPLIADLFDAPAREALIAGYEARSPGATPGDITMQLATDALFRQPQIRLAEAQAVHQADTYMYLFEWRTPISGGLYGSPHAVELPFFFRTFGAPSVDDFVGPDPPLGISDGFIDASATFARTGKPSASGWPAWPAYDVSARRTMRIDVESVVESDPLAADREAWSSIPFDSVTPSL